MSEQQFEERYWQLFAAAMRFAMRHRIGRNEAETIAADAVTQLWERLRVTSVDNAEGLLRKIVDRLCIKRLRLARRELSLGDFQDKNVADRNSCPENQLTLKLLRASLSPTERAIVEGREANQSFQSIANELRMSREAARMHVVRLRNRFHRELENPFSEN